MQADGLRAELVPADVAAIRRLVVATGVFSAAEVAIAEELAVENLNRGPAGSGYHFLLADGTGGLAGYTCFGEISGTVHRWELYWIAVDPGARRAGLARRLQRASEDAVRAMGGVRLIAHTSTTPAYAPARAFYRAERYELLAEIADWHDDGDGLAIFGKSLG